MSFVVSLMNFFASSSVMGGRFVSCAVLIVLLECSSSVVPPNPLGCWLARCHTPFRHRIRSFPVRSPPPRLVEHLLEWVVDDGDRRQRASGIGHRAPPLFGFRGVIPGIPGILNDWPAAWAPAFGSQASGLRSLRGRARAERRRPAWAFPAGRRACVRVFPPPPPPPPQVRPGRGSPR